MERQTLNVVDVAFGGDGIARVDGKVFFVEHAVPGETVEALILQDKKRFARARSETVIESAPDAVKPFCPVFSRCGGCDWQHVPYDKQLIWKKQFIESALSKNANFQPLEPLSILPSHETKAFRNRIKLKAALRGGRLEFGYFAKGTHDLVKINVCPIAEEPINAFLKKLAEFSFAPDKNWRGKFEIQRVGESGQCLLSFDRTANSFPELKTLQKAFPEHEFDTQKSVAFEVYKGMEYRTRAGQFQQVNARGNHDLRDWIFAKIAHIQAKTVVDMFCGSGNLSLGLSRIDSSLKVWGIEYSETAIETAIDNVRANGVQGFVYKAGPANRIREIFNDLPNEIDCVITDPPRAGMDDSLEDLLGLRPSHILSVSCDPNTFARDLKRLLESGYRVREIRGVDFFPHSYHIETLAHLSLD